MNIIKPELEPLSTPVFRISSLHQDLDQAADGIKAGQIALSSILEAEQSGEENFPLSGDFAKGCILRGISAHLTFIHACLDELRANIETIDQMIRITPQAWQAEHDATSAPGVE